MRGRLSAQELTDTFQRIESRRASGVLHVTRGQETKRVYFKHGRIIGAASGHPEDPAPAGPVGERAAQGAILSSIFRIEDGEFRFEERLPAEIHATSSLDLSPEEVARAVIRSAEESPSPSPHRVAAWPDDAPFDLRTPISHAESTLSTPHNMLLGVLKNRLHTGVTTADILKMSPLSREETLDALRALVAAGIVGVADPSSEEPRSKTHPSASPDENNGSLFPSGAPPKKLGRFEVRRVLGRGSMGAVLLAQDPAIDRTVAIKLIQTAIHLPEAQQEKYKERFYREASAAGQLIHPNIVTVFDVGHADDDTPFIVMEYVNGRTLTEILENDVLSFDRAFQVAFDILDGLSFAHAQGIVHRDIKPGNIIVTPDFRGKIMDFGIAHVVGSELTKDDDVLGSPCYMAPEQLSKGRIDQRTDLFSFAVVLYRVLTGELPFTGDSFAAIAQAILKEEPVPPDAINRAVSPALRNVVLRCLEKSPDDRYERAEDVAAALRSARQGAAEPPPKRLRPRTSRRDLWVPVSAALLFGALLVFGLVSRSTEPEPRAPGLVQDTPAPSIETAPPPFGSTLGQPPLLGDEEPQPLGEQEAPPDLPRPKSTAGRTGDLPPIEPKARPRPAPATSPTRKTTKRRNAGTKTATGPSLADLFYNARIALERGDLSQSQAWLEELLLKDPTFAGAADMLTEVTDRIWEDNLPLVFEARHNHRLGGCNGELDLTALGVRFRSDAHDWAWSHDDIRVLEHPDERILFVETYEKDVLGLKNKRYKFKLDRPLDEADWLRYERLTR